MWCVVSSFTFLIILTASCASHTNTYPPSAPYADNWRQVGRKLGEFLGNCFRNPVHSRGEMFDELQKCLKRKSASVLDRMAVSNVTKVFPGIVFVRFKRENETEENERSLELINAEGNWKSYVLKRLQQLLHTHELKIHLKEVLTATSQIEARGRRKHNMFGQLIMFGLIAAAFIVIPMGFQFLAIVGGKALLLAKMALLLSSIQGLKRIATSSYNYGLYSYGGGPWQYDRQWPYDAEGHGATGHGGRHDAGVDFLHPRRGIS